MQKVVTTSLAVVVWSLSLTYAMTTYPTSEAFLEAEWATCQVATDGCNNVQINDGKLWAMTMKYCEDIYGSEGQEEWMCLDDSLNEQTYGFLTDEEYEEYTSLKEDYGFLMEKITSAIDEFSNKLLEVTEYDMNNAFAAVDSLLSRLDAMIADTTSPVRQDVITLVRYEVMVAANRRSHNTGEEWSHNQK